MNRIAGRARVALVLVLVLLGGLAFFLGEFAVKSADWVVFSGSPHVYNGSNIGCGIITDRDGTVLLDVSGERKYSRDAALRKATLHWLGDRGGYISAPALAAYSKEMAGYDLLNGVYAYGDTGGQAVLTLSAEVQKAALEAMGSYKGTIAVYNYKTGEILCAVTTPTYDPDNVPDIAGDTTGRYEGVYLNRFTQAVYIPGSIFKIVTLAAAFETIPDIQNQTFSCTGSYEIDGHTVTCESKHGKQSLKDAFSNSCNCAFAQIAEQLGQETLERYVEKFGVTQSVTFDGITTKEGNFDAGDGYALDVAWSAIGQHKDQVNPASFLTFLGAVASGGKGPMPYLVDTVTVGKQTTYSAKTVWGKRIMDSRTAELLQEYLRNNVEVKYGAGNFPGLTVCAKSGTGEVGGDKKPNAMFAGFVADEEYPLAFLVAVENGGYGSHVCVPILAKVLAACVEAMDGR